MPYDACPTRGGPIPPKTEIVNRESRFQESGIGNLTTSTTVVRFSQKTGIVNRDSQSVPGIGNSIEPPLH